MLVVIGSDHAGFLMKREIVKFLRDLGKDVLDVGTYSLESVDYPDIAKNLTDKIKNNNALGVLICGTGIGMSISANKVKGIRCALCHDAYTAEYSRKHNDANIIAFGGRTTGLDIAKQMVEIFIETSFEGGRHERRLNKILKLEDI